MPKTQSIHDLQEFLSGFNSDSEVIAILKRIGVRPCKALGQNFLVDEGVSESIVGSLNLSCDDTVIEIGPGLGSLTRHLVGKVKRLILIEFDRKIYEYLNDVLSDRNEVVVLHQDAVNFDLRELFADSSVKAIGNLPYSSGTEIIRNFMAPPSPIDLAVFMLQKEVVDRFCATPRTKNYGLLTVMTGAFWDIERIQDLSFEPFSPRPAVGSAVIRLTPCDGEKYPPFNERVLRRIVKCGFQERRKQLKKRLPLGDVSWVDLCDKLNLSLTARAEELKVSEWIEMARLIDANPLKDNPQKDNEMFDVVDENDQVLRQVERSKVHKKGLLHRAVHVFVFNNRGDLFLQKRSLLKDSSPGLWDSSASGHLDVGEDYHDAAVRELAEELGIRQEVKMICSIKPSEKTGWEFVHLFKCEHGGPFNFPYSEIDCGEFFTTDMIENWISERPEDFASGFIECWENYH